MRITFSSAYYRRTIKDSMLQPKPKTFIPYPLPSHPKTRHMPAYRLVRASNDAFSLPYVPVVVVFGGTSGIGRAITKRLAGQLQGRVHVVVVGRNKVEAEKLFAALPLPDQSNPGLECAREFIFCDLFQMANVHRACTEILDLFPKIDYLVLTAGVAWLGPRCETDEGIEKLFALRFYWKFAAINDLLPGLRAARGRGEAASVLACLGMGVGPRIDFADLGAKLKHWKGVVPLMQGVSYGDLALALFAERNPDIGFTHMFPGWVRTEANSPQAFSNPIWKLIIWLLGPLMWLLFIPVDVSAENMVYGLLNGERGFFQRNTVGDNVGPRNVDYSDKDKEAFWKHCVETTRSAPK